jgi:hypothetical protein
MYLHVETEELKLDAVGRRTFVLQGFLALARCCVNSIRTKSVDLKQTSQDYVCRNVYNNYLQRCKGSLAICCSV